MASKMCHDVDDHAINLVELEFREGVLYFKAEDDDFLESDHFHNLEEPKNAILRNVSNKVLIKKMNMAVFEDMIDSEVQDNAPQTIFIIQTYRETNPKGLAVAILVKSENQIYSLSCLNKELHFKKGAAPDYIPSETSDFIFYQKKVIGHEKMEFESSMYPGYFLACEKNNIGYFKLVLKEVHQDEDMLIKFIVQYC